jgi:hypothetical protein
MESLEEEEEEVVVVPNARREWIAFGVVVVENEKALVCCWARAATSNIEERQVNFMVV